MISTLSTWETGLGALFVQSVQVVDVPVMAAYLMFVGLVFVVVNLLTDLVYPVEIVGKRLRTKEDGSKLLKVVLDEKERGGVDYRLDTYSEVYKRLTGKGVNFEFPQHTEH